MRRGVKAVVWIAVFAACAGVGAFIASKTNPFPPGVEDPGARSTPSVTPTSTPSTVAKAGYVVRGSARTRHDLFVGGSCATDWVIELHVAVDAAGRATGTGVALLQGKLRCDFPTAQTQATRIALDVGGHLRGHVLDLSVRSGAMTPNGSSDFGGLVKTLLRFPSIDVAGGAGSARVSVRVNDGDLGAYVATYAVKAAADTP